MKALFSAKNTLIAGLMASLLCVSLLALAGCGSEEEESTSSDETTASSTSSSSSSSETESSSSSSDDAFAQVADQLTEAYMGTTSDGGTVYYAGGQEGQLGVIVFLDSTNSQNASFVGPVSSSDNMVTITDQTNGSSLTFSVTSQDDGTILLDLGDLGQAKIASCEVSEVINAIKVIDENTEAVA